MAFKDVLLTLRTYPEPTSPSAVEHAVSLAAALEAQISVIACEAKIRAPKNFLSDILMNIPALVATELEKSKTNVRDLLATFQNAAEKRGVMQERIVKHCFTEEVPNLFVDFARVRDLTIVPVPEGDFVDPWYAESIIFGSGRPTIIIPERKEASPVSVLNTLMVAWDFSRPASRAVADALPILEKAKQVFVVTVTNEKKLNAGPSGEELAKNLAKHGVEVVTEEIDADGRRIGDVLESRAVSHKADLLIMGAYGHSHIREFMLGGATKSMLTRPPLPILLSH